jgi:peptidoglycan hydrolase FlgJ
MPTGPITPAQLAAAPPKLRQAAQAFEAQALSQLLAPAFATVDGSRSAFGGGAAEAQWRPMLLDAMAGAAARSGQGVGIGDMVLREMLRLQAAGEPSPEPETTTP